MSLEARVFIKNLRISVKNAKIVARQIINKPVEKAKRFLENLINQKISLNGKYYTKTTIEILKALHHAEESAKHKKMDLSKLRIKTIKVHKGPKLITPKRYKFRGRVKKNAHLEIILSY